MIRTMFRLLFSLVLVNVLAWSAQAGQVRGKVVEFNADTSVIKIKVENEEKTFKLSSEVKVVEVVGKGKKMQDKEAADGVKAIKKGHEVILTSLPNDEKIVRVRIEDAKKKKNK